MRKQPMNRILSSTALGSIVPIQRRDDGFDVVHRRITVRLSVVLEIHWSEGSDLPFGSQSGTYRVTPCAEESLILRSSRPRPGGQGMG
jgi:hypothetical protein